MRKHKTTAVLLIICCLIMIISGCLQREQTNPNTESNPAPIPIPAMMEEIEADLIEVMGKADLIPYYEGQIAAKKQAEEEQAAQKDSKSKSKEFTSKPITLDDALLLEIIMQEKPAGKEIKEEDIPEDIIFVWHKINSRIASLHEKWNKLQTKLQDNDVPQTVLAGFDDQLNQLTIASTKQEHFTTMIHANALTSYLPQFASKFDTKFPIAIYYINYYVRQIVLDSETNDESKVNENLSLLKHQEAALTSQLTKEKATEEANMLKTSISDLEQAITLKDLNLIKIKASVVIKNIATIKEEFLKNKK